MKQFKNDFPFFSSRHTEKPIIYLDNAATTQKLKAVIDRLQQFYSFETAPVHRGIYAHAEGATALFENSRAQVADFFHATSSTEIAFTSGTTESINAVVFGFVEQYLKVGDEIIISELEHNANVIPWQQVAKKTGAILRYIPVQKSGDLDYEAYEKMLSKKVKFVSITHASNAIGTLVSVERIIKKAHEVEALVLVDAAQTAGHVPIDVQKNNVDFLVCSAHKMYGPFGIGILYVKQKHHNRFSPFRFGGGIISEISHSTASFLPFPTRLEAGTPAIAEVISFAESIVYIKKHFAEIQKHERSVFDYLLSRLASLKHVKVLGSAEKLHTVSFLVKNHHAHDVAAYLDQHSIAVRAGTHCAHIVSSVFDYQASVRVSIGMYTTKEDIDNLISCVSSLQPNGVL